MYDSWTQWKCLYGSQTEEVFIAQPFINEWIKLEINIAKVTNFSLDFFFIRSDAKYSDVRVFVKNSGPMKDW